MELPALDHCHTLGIYNEMSTLKQLAKEFWLPFIVASTWTGFNYYNSNMDIKIFTVVADFSASFFLVSWATGQFVRVSRQARAERGLATVENRIIELTGKLDHASNRLISTITGGDSFAHFAMSPVGPDKFSLVALHSGGHPLANLNARICDLSLFKINMAAGDPFASDINVNIGDLAPQLATFSGVTLKASRPMHDWNVFFSARNGLWTQRIRGRIVNNEWKFAHVVTRHEGANTKTLMVAVPNGFPLIGEVEFDHAEREAPLTKQP